MSEVIKINYYFDDRSFHFKQLNKSTLISDLLQQIQEDHSDEDEIKTEKLGKSAFLNGKKLPETDSLEKYLDVLQYNALFISNDPTKELKVNLIPANKDDY